MRRPPVAATLALVVTVAVATAVGAGAQTSPAANSPLSVSVLVDGVPAGVPPGPEVAVGATLAWTYEVANTGSGNLWSLYLWQDGVGRAECADRSLAPGETVRCTASSVAGAGPYQGEVYGWAWDDAGAEAAVTTPAHYTSPGSSGTPPYPTTTPPSPARRSGPAMNLAISVAGMDAARLPGPVVSPGSTVAFRYEVSNTGSTGLWDLRVSDDAFGSVPCPRNYLAPGETVACVLERSAQSGVHASIARAWGWDFSGGNAAVAGRHHYVGGIGAPRVEIEALVDGFDGDRPPGPRVQQAGQSVLFTYVVANTGGMPLTRVLVSDEVPGRVSCPGTDLGVGETMICLASREAGLGAFASAGRVTASAGDIVVSDSDPIYYHVREEPRIHDLDLQVTVNGRRADDAASAPIVPVGGEVRLAYALAYAGNDSIYNLRILDPRVPEPAISCDGDDILEPEDDARQCWATVWAAPGPQASLVTVVAWDANGSRIVAEAWARYYGMP